MLALVCGGTASGKSEYAELLCSKLLGDKIYLATMFVYDEESGKKVDRHRAMREGRGFITIEKPMDLQECTFKPNSTVLLECLSNLLANEMYMKGFNLDPSEKILSAILKASKEASNIVVVSNSVFFDGIDYKETEQFIKNIGNLNALIAKEADIVAEVVAGIPILHKGGALI